MAKQKELMKNEIIPKRNQLDALGLFFERNADANGEVSCTHREILEALQPIISSEAYLYGVLAYLRNRDYVEKVYSGQRNKPSKWQAKAFIEAYRTMPARGEQAAPGNKPEVTVVRTPIETDASKEVVDNTVALHEIKQVIEGMTSYLQSLPTEMGTHLNTLSQKLDSTDSGEVERLQAELSAYQEKERIWTTEKQALTNRATELTKELDTAQNTERFNASQVVRLRHSIVDDINRILAAPAWTIRQSGPSLVKGVEQKLDAIFQEIGIDTSI